VRKGASRARIAAIATLALISVLPIGHAQADDGYDATIRRTEFGIPHIKGNSWGDLGFGVGYAFAQDNVCVMADNFVTVNAERSKYFGPDGTYRSEANGVVPTNLQSDFYYQWINESGVIEGLVDGTWPNAKPLSPGIVELTEGWAAGYNKYLETNTITDPKCAGADWVRPVTALDVYRRYYQLIMFASKGALLPQIVAATPPTPGLPRTQANADGIDTLTTADTMGSSSITAL
jgi:acyl-homoserine-lactone acylase